ncbi:lipopolysaccharide biosynthesis protein [Kineococcus auxinigenes]|uniref:lipopolysaccharide biosynthesis protein n=1 Tax=unclassified Kineococcus TaxID=2621656 RepID=UPI003D7CA7E5
MEAPPQPSGPGAPGGPQPQGGGRGGTLRRKAFVGVLWASLEKWSVRLSTLVGFVLLGRLLQPEEFGVVALAMVFITLLTVVADAGFSTYLIQAREVGRRTTSTAFYISLTLGALLAGALVAVARPLAAAFDAPELAQVLPAVSVAVLVAGASSVPVALLSRELRFRDLAVRQVAATVTSVVVAIALAFAGAGVWALVAQHVVRSVVACAVLWARTDFRPAWAFDRVEARAMTRFGASALLVQLGQQTRDQGESLLVGAVTGTTSLGHWTVARRFVGVVVDLFSSVVNVVAQPVFAKVRDDRRQLARALGSTSALGALLLAPVLVALALLSDVVVPAVFGSQWRLAASIAAVLALRSLVLSLSEFHRSALLAAGRPGAELAVTVVQLAGQVTIILLVGGGDLVALAWWLTGWMALSWPLRAAVVRKLLGVGWGSYAETGRVLLATALAGGLVLALARWWDPGTAGTVLVGALGVLAYALLVLLLCRRSVAEVLTSLRSLRRRRPPVAAAAP